MCGIVGGVGKLSHQVIASNLNLLNRRGPDSQNCIQLDNFLTLGASRLAMTDPHPRSNQPMVDGISGNVLVFNGEIYNYKSIRKNLSSHGITFKTESDTEVLLNALTVWGVDIIPKLQGMFAFVFFDKKHNKLIMARDYLGKKPLFFYINKSELFFSSQIKFIRKFLKSYSLDMNSVSMFIKLGYIIDPETMYNEIKSISPGQFIIIDLTNISAFEKYTYIPLVIQTPSDKSLAETIEESLIERIEGHNSFALSLSGGLDSAILASISAKLNLPVTSFSMKYTKSDKSKFSLDAVHANQIANKLGIKHITVDIMGPEKIEAHLNEFSKSMDEPNSNPTGLAMMQLYKSISEQGFRLVITGDGADEIFGGYERFRLMNRYGQHLKLDSKTFKKLINEKNPRFKNLQSLCVLMSSSKSKESWLYWHLICGDHFMKSILPDFNDLKFELFGDELSLLFGDKKSAFLLYRDLRIWLTMDSNKKLDRISMWHSIEARSPFQSENVIGDGLKFMSVSNFKYSKRDIFHTFFPALKLLPTIPQKTGFISPLGYWLRNNPQLIMESINYIRETIPLDKKISKSLIESPKNYDYDKMKILWNVITLSYWTKNQN